MHLKSLTMRGFKSFAAATTFSFEPGITCVVGPNGSGKSNVVDALAWVMGEQGARSLRGAKMEDVVFAGTSGRPPLGRAQVSLTIDNGDGALPIAYTEVTITRTMFRNGGSEYAINGSPARLLDVQELLADSGIGREMHVIVGQGQLDAVLAASPQERRGFLEEAAGVLKHRKRKEKALRKLEAMQANLTRLRDLTAELRRQLKPLGRQADVARRAASMQADLRDAGLRLLAEDLLVLTRALEQDEAAQRLRRQRAAQLQALLAQARQRESEAEALGSADAPRLAELAQTWHALTALQERFRAISALAAERLRHLDPGGEGDLDDARLDDAGGGSGARRRDDERSEIDPDALDREAAGIRTRRRDLASALELARRRLAEATCRRKAAEEALTEEERRLVAAARAAADRRETLARLAGSVAAQRSKAEAGEAERERVCVQIEAAQEAAAQAAARYAAVESRIAELDSGEEDLDADHERAVAELAAIEARRAELLQEERAAERDRAAAAARTEALAVGIDAPDAAPVLLEGSLPGVLGEVASALAVEPGYERALAAALGAAADAVAVADIDTARAALLLLKERNAGQATVLLAAPAAATSAATAATSAAPAGAGAGAGSATPPLGAGQRRAADVVEISADLAPALRRLLAEVVVVEDLDAAAELLRRWPSLTAVTLDGDVLGPHVASGGSGRTPSRLEAHAAVDEARDAQAAATSRAERVRFALAGLEDSRRRAAERVEDALGRLHDSDARQAAVAEELGRLGADVRASTAEAERLTRQAGGLDQMLGGHRRGLEELETQLREAEADAGAAGARDADAAAPERDGPDGREPEEERDRLAGVAAAARAAEVEARLAARTTEERAAALAGRAEALEDAAGRERDRVARAAARRAARAEQARRARLVGAAAERALEHLAVSVRTAAAEHEQAGRLAARRDDQLRAARAEVRERSAQLESELGATHRDELARVEQQLRAEALQERALAEFGVEATVVVEEYGPAMPVPTPDGLAVPYVRAEQLERRDRAERALAALGRVNPLALEEYAALEERQRFLGEQLEDLEATRRDLLAIVAEIDERVDTVFAAAFEDTARAFEAVFARLFPGGEGRLVLTDPADVRASGVEVEARPPGKKIRRLSLLSGGERALTAIALLVAIFQARPSPFYVLDEVEAALDDTNLSRLLSILVELRASSQLVVVTHQKRTMEIADALYGVSMRGDGVSAVISSRLAAPASA